ncbi:proline--tRNA ligase [Candidatus Woesearchaeota archaeon]|nr:proline--tRNA ligase [Candidatus Woesearchaeota archaeon]
MTEEKKRGITVKKTENFSEWFTQICSEQGAQLVDIRYGIQGFIVHRPWAMKVLNRIYTLLEQAVEADGHEPHLFPTVILEDNLTKEAEHAGFIPDVFWVTQAGEHTLEKKWALRPTGETQIYPMYSLWIRSYNDLPYKGYQSRHTTFRHEMTTRPFLRGREFMFFETHDVFATHKEALTQIKVDMQIMDEVIRDKLKVPFIFFRRPQWDKFKGADDTYASDSLLPDGRRLQISSTHDLGHNFAEAFNITFHNKDGKEEFGWQTCFGPGIWRIMACLIGIHGDDTGLILPFDLGPQQIVIIPILKGNDTDEEVKTYCEDLKTALKQYRVIIDDSDNSPGYKYNHWEMKGVPLRIEIGSREAAQGTITLARRLGEKKTTVKQEDLNNAIITLANELDTDIGRRAEAYFKDRIKHAQTKEELIHVIKNHRGFVTVPFCTTNNEGAVCAEHIKADTGGADVCGVPLAHAQEPKKDDVCVQCGKKATVIVYCAKSV